MMIEMKSNQNREGRGYENKRRETKMGKARKSVWNRLMASVLSAVMVLGLLPISFSDVYAATTEHPEGVTITVTDEWGPVAGADVAFSIVEAPAIGDISDVAPDQHAVTDAYGCVVVLTQDKFVPHLLLTATVNKLGYAETLIDQLITSDTQDILAELIKIPTGITVSPVNVDSNGTAQNLVTITGAETYTVSYKVNDAANWTSEAKATNPGIYNVQVKVEKTGYETQEYTVQSVIRYSSGFDAGTIYTNKDYDYNSHNVCNKDNFSYAKPPFNNVTTLMTLYEVTDTGTLDTITEESETVPQVKNAGNYKLRIRLKDINGISIYEKYYDVVIKRLPLSRIDSFFRKENISTYNEKCDGVEHNAVTNIESLRSSKGYYLKYSTDGGTTWKSEYKIKDQGIYNFKVRVFDSTGNYSADFDVQAIITSGIQDISFTNASYSNNGTTTVDLNITSPEKNVFDFSIIGGRTSGAVTYKIAKINGETRNISEFAEIDPATGELEVTAAGSILVTATKPGDANWDESSISFTLHVRVDGAVSFSSVTDPETAISYILGTKWSAVNSKEVISALTATKKYSYDLGKVTYSIDKTDVGLKCDSDSGEISVLDRARLVTAMQSGPLKVKVTANKEATLITSAAEAYYFVEICFLTTPTEACVLSGTSGEGGWYTSDVYINPPISASSTFKISFDYDPSHFKANAVIQDQFFNQDVYVYLRDEITGGITNKILIEGVKIDQESASDMEILFSSPFDKNADSSEYYYNSPLIVTLRAKASGSGMSRFDWKYIGEDTEEGKTPTTFSGTITEFTQDNGYFVAQITLPPAGEQLRGTISFTATKGNGKTNTTSRSTTVIYDTTKPISTVLMPKETQAISNHLYYSEDVTFTINLTEANFYASDVNAKLFKDGVFAGDISPQWEKTGADTNTGTFSVFEDGDYYVTIDYADRSGNEMESFKSPDFTIDTTVPVIGIQYDQENATISVSVTDQNFRKEDVILKIVSTNIMGETIDTNIKDTILQTCEWKRIDNKYTAQITGFSDAIYALTVDYSDLAGNPSKTGTISKVIIDSSGPVIDPETGVTYSVPVFEQVLQFVTFGFYNPSVEVTFTAVDEISGIDYFEWTFTPQDDSGDKKSTSLSGILPVTTDTSTGTASLLLSAEKYDQLKGNISFTATDKMGNESNEVTDDKRVIVVDTISPTMKVEYSPADRTDNGSMYYKGAAAATLTVEEANFYAENIIVTATKDGGEAFAISPVWTDVSTKEAPDTHVGTFTLAAPADQSGDGDYVITITYKDFSGNQMTGESGVHSGVYTSGRITIDTLAPVVNVSYSNTNAVNVTNDPEGNVRSYFSAEQVATITIREHNFKAEEVMIDVKAKNISGADLDQNVVVRQSEWVSDGDSHTKVITYPGDANYSFDLDYKDTANNAMADRPVDYFTVDMTVPENLAITYSESLMDTILENISFGFYNAKTTVTIKADDSVSGVFGISYNGNQATQNVSYSNGNKTATLVFELPGSSGDSQYDGFIDCNVKDRSGNDSGKKDDKRIIVDSISPTAAITFNKPAFEENHVSYYNQAILGEITINETNFFAKNVMVSVSKDGESATALDTSWTNADKDTHVGTFTLSEDGDYVVTIAYTDYSKNSMTNYTSQVMTLDTLIVKPTIQFNGKNETGKAYRDDVIPGVSIEDENYKKYDITLTRTSFGTKNEDVTDLFITDLTEKETGVSGAFDTFEKAQENDGIYKMTVSVEDKAGNSAMSTAFFTVNRYGSVYEYSDYLASLVKDGGAYVSSITEDLIIMEYNPDQILEDSLQIEVTRDGKPLTDLVFDTSEVKNEITASEDGGWYQYQYSIGKDNFTQDGVYKISVSTIDATGNTMENNKSAEHAIIFHVDNEAPEITSVRGLEKEIIDATKLDVQYTVYDTIGLKSVQVFVNGVEDGSAVTDFSGDINNYTGSFSMKESGAQQSVRIVVEDLAGNITDTDSTTFMSAFVFRRNVTISTNFFVRWYANTPLFWGSTIGVVALAGVMIALVVNRKLRPRRRR